MCRLTAEGDKQCRCQVEYQLVYVTSVNAFIKKAIERGMLVCPKTGVCPSVCLSSFEQFYPGASNGITKNFETVQEVLKDFVALRDASKAPAVKVSRLFNAHWPCCLSCVECVWSYPAYTVCICSLPHLSRRESPVMLLPRHLLSPLVRGSPGGQVSWTGALSKALSHWPHSPRVWSMLEV